MRSFATVLITLAVLLSGSMVATARAEAERSSSAETRSSSDDDSQADAGRDVLDSNLEDPQSLLPEIRERRAEKDSLLPVSPLFWLHEFTDRGKKLLSDSTGIQLGADLTHLFQGLSEAISHEDQWGTATTANLAGSWELIARGKPTRGQLFFHGQARWEYGKPGPEELGPSSVGSAIGTANTFSAYQSSPVLLRNLYWQQGSEEAGWAYRIGKITPDATLSSSQHLNASTTFMPNTSIGSFTSAHADSGLGVAAAWFPTDRIRLLGLFSDANANRENFGDPGEGDFYKSVELGMRIAPRTDKAGYSKLTFWHTDGTDDGEAANANTGEAGWGFFVKLEQELTADGRAVGIVRYGRSFNDSAVYKQLASVHFLYYDPSFLKWIRNDVIGVAFNWAEIPPSEARSEYNIEAFYRFPIFPSVDTTISYQSVIRPALDRGNDHASVFSLRIRTTF
jgi:hypothetical protein